MTNTLTVSARGLRKGYGKTSVLEGIDLDVPAGSVYALLGPNGAGKTTTVNILTTLVAPDAGTATVAGFDITRQSDEVRAAIGVTGQFSAIDGLLTGHENMLMMAALRHLPSRQARRITVELFDKFDLSAAADRRAATYSGGMKRRLDLAMTLIGSPTLIFLDEPTTGLDPRSRQTMWDVVRDLVHTGVTIFLTTQYLDEADELADHVGLLDHGRVVAEGTPQQLKQMMPVGEYRLEFAGADSVAKAQRLLVQAGVNAVLPRQDAAPGPGADADARDSETAAFEAPLLEIPLDTERLRVSLDTLNSAGIPVVSVSAQTPNLDDVFFALTGGSREPVGAEG